MSNCLNESRVRAAADGEAVQAERIHLEACAECRGRVDAARRAVDELVALTGGLVVPESLRDGVARVLATRENTSGATTLRDLPERQRYLRAWLTAGGVAAAVLAIVFLFPTPDAPRALSAAEILDRSLRTLAPASGVELREFDLELQLPRIASIENGTYRIEQLVDHDAPGRYRLLRYGPDGALLDGVSEDAAAGRRTAVVRLDGRTFAFSFDIDSTRAQSLRDMERHHVEAMVRLLQAAAGQSVQEVGEGRAKRYVIELPEVAGGAPASFWELRRARVVVDGNDFQILELAVAGSYMAEPFAISFRLRRRDVRAPGAVPPNAFDLPRDDDAIEIAGAGSEDLARDLLVSTLRELGKARR